MRALRTLLISAVLAVGLAAPVAAQTTSTTMPPVRSIPVTPAPGVTTTTTAARTTTTTAPAAVSGETAAAPLADTGIPADKLVPFGFVLIGLGAALTGAARRYGRPAYTFL